MTTTSFKKIIDITDAKATGPGQWMGHCPNPDHNDSDPSFSITWTGETALFNCFAGCEREEFAKGLDMQLYDLGGIEMDLEGAESADSRPKLLKHITPEEWDQFSKPDQLHPMVKYAILRWGLTWDHVEAYDLRVDGEDTIVIPFKDPETGAINTYQKRTLTGKTRWVTAPGSHYNWGVFEPIAGHDQYVDFLTVPEGPGDALALASAGFTAVFSTGTSTDHMTRYWFGKHVYEYTHVLLLGDPDKPGQMRDGDLYGLYHQMDENQYHPSFGRFEWKWMWGQHDTADCMDVSDLRAALSEYAFQATIFGSRENHNITMLDRSQPTKEVIDETLFMTFPTSVEVPEILPPSIIKLQDGTGLLYPGEYHAFMGEPESGKTWLALYGIMEIVHGEETAVLIDCEDNWYKSYSRLLTLGADPEYLAQYFIYVDPLGPTTNSAIERIVEAEPALVVIDSTGESMSSEHLDQNSDHDVAQWSQKLVKPLRQAGAAVLTLDHVVKSNDDRGRWAIGSQRKLAGITGAAYRINAEKKWSMEDAGSMVVDCSKDRNGFINRSGVVATILVNPHDGYLDFLLKPGGGKRAERKKTTAERIVQEVLAYHEENPAATHADYRQNVTGKSEMIQSVVTHLRDTGQI